MRGPLQFDGREIERWADNPHAAYELPRLVRRLLQASTKLRALEMASGSAGNLGGWDGLCVASERSRYCPPGRSGWELSTEKGVKAKLDKDYKKRVEKPDPLGPEDAYVAVTARRHAKKQDWVTMKSREADWAEVRLIDADDLAHWLEDCPAVGAWFASEQLGRPSNTFVTLDQALERWSQATTPRLPARILLAGRERQVAALGEWLARPTPRRLLVVGPTRSEAAMFAAAALRELGDVWADRVLVVDTAAGWRWLVQQQTDQPLILVPSFEEFNLELGTGMHWVVVPLDRSGAVQERDDVVDIDEPQPWRAFARELRKLGFGEREADIEAEKSGGRLQNLRRTLGLTEASLPGWLEAVDAALLVAMLLVGAWQPGCEGDRRAIELLGVKADELERACQKLMTVREAPVLRRDGAYEWGSAVGAWRLLHARLSDSDFERFERLAVVVLGEDDPRYELPANERYLGAVTGKMPSCSEALRKGVAQSLLFVAKLLSPDRLRRGEQAVWSVVHRVLTPHWRRWASLRDLLPTLAEASPREFLDRVNASMDDVAGVIQLFAQEGSSPSWGSTPHVGLLWALEILAWSRVHMSDAASALARLARADPARHDRMRSRVGNRPLASLEAIFHIISPQTLVEDDERSRTLERLAQQYPDVCFDLVMELLDDLRHKRVLLPRSMRPSLDTEVPATPDPPTRNILRSRRVHYLTTACELAGNDPLRWGRLVRYPAHRVFGTTIAKRVLDDAAACVSVDPEGSLWHSVRAELTGLHRYHDDENDERIRHLQELYDKLTPADIILRHLWKFERSAGWPDQHLPHDYNTQIVVEDQRREEALQEILRHKDSDLLLADLTGRLTDRTLLGRALARSPGAPQLRTLLVDNPPPPALESLAVPFAIGLYWASDRNDYGFLEHTLRLWESVSRHEDACSFACNIVAVPEVWDIVDRIGEPLRACFWAKASLFQIDKTSPLLEHAISNLLDAGNLTPALSLAYRRGEKLETSTIVRILKYIQNRILNNGQPDDDHGAIVAALFRILDKRLNANELCQEDIDQIIGLELAFIHYFDVHEGRAPHFLSRFLARNPHFFLSLIEICYRNDDDRDRSPLSDESMRVIANAGAVLSAWDDFPGNEFDDPRAWEPVLHDWALDVLEGARANNRLMGGQTEVAKVLARAPVAEDGRWPCVAARRLLESGDYPKLRQAMLIAKHNLRGGTIRGAYEGGEQERVLAREFRATADALRPQYPETAALNILLADDYEHEANNEDRQARDERIRDGVELGSPANEDESSMNTSALPNPITRVSKLEITQVGPFADVAVEFAPRINLLVGDNSLGKTFVLDVAWWTLTGAWAGAAAQPTKDQRDHQPAIRHVDEHDRLSTSGPDRVNNEWPRYVLEPKPGREPDKRGWPIADALVIYAQVDGCFTVWDRVRNTAETLDAYRFTAAEAWNRLESEKGEVLCRGLLADWRDWERDDAPRNFAAFKAVMEKLAEPDVGFVHRGYARRGRTDSVPVPLIELPYGDVPIIHISAAWKRILTLAYLLVWTYHDHRDEAERQGVTPSRSMVLLIDEIETHLHPRWQRVILPALLAAVKALGDLNLQIVATTHSPMVMTSIEVDFDPERDTVLLFELEGSVVGVEEFRWAKFGDANSWLSSLFGLREATSPAAEAALEAATHFIHGDSDRLPSDLDTKEKIDEALRRSLAESHPFWVRWMIFTGVDDEANLDGVP